MLFLVSAGTQEKAARLPSNGLRFSQLVRNELLSNCRISNCRISNSCAVNNAVNYLLNRVGVYLCRLSLVTTRSERNSCNSYEHKY